MRSTDYIDPEHVFYVRGEGNRKLKRSN